MKFHDMLRNKQTLAPVAGGAPEPGEQLAAGVPYMDSRTAATVTQWVDAWREMPRQEFQALARDL